MQFIKHCLAYVLVAALLVAAVPAHASILFAGGEDIDFVLVGGVAPDTTAGNFRAGYARLALAVGGPAQRFYTPALTAGSTFWFHAVAKVQNGTTSTNNEMMCALSADGLCRLVIRSAATNQTVKISKKDAAGTYTDLCTATSGSFPLTSATKMDWSISYSTSGSTTLYVGGVNVCSFSGDVTTNSTTQLNQFYMSNPDGFGGFWWSEIIVATTDTRDMSLFTCAPQTNGTTQNWTGTASSVNPTTINDTLSISTGSANTVGNFTCPSLPSGNFTVPAVVQSARVQGVPGSLTNFRFNSRPVGGGADFDTTADIPVGGVFLNYPNSIVTTNPATSAPWTTGALGSGVNFGIKSRP